MGHKKYSKRQLPPCPDPDKYIVVKTAGGYYWRKKRGTVKEAKLNSVLSRNNETAKITGPASALLFRRLAPFMQGISKGNMALKIAGLFMKTYHEKGRVDFSKLKDIELNQDWPLHRIFYGEYSIVTEAEAVTLHLHLSRGTVKRQNTLATNYYFEAILVWGDMTNEKRVRVESEETPLYSFKQRKLTDCMLRLPLPKGGTPWMLLLKVNCHEGNEFAAHAKHYAMKVVGIGGVGSGE